jgi:transposase
MRRSYEQLFPVPHYALVGIAMSLEIRVEELQAELLSLRGKLDEALEQLRKMHRCTAPFAKDPVEAKARKRPGRKAGKGTFTRRAPPVPTAADQVVERDAPLSVEDRVCPYCNLPLQTHDELATLIDVPETPARVITRINVEVGRCGRCGHRARGQHPSLRPRQWGASAHQLGPRVQAQALALHYDAGLPMCKVPAVMHRLTGISMTQSALTQLAIRLCAPDGAWQVHYQELRKQARASSTLNTDDTGWRISTTPAYLMGFFTRDIALFQIRLQHRHQEVLEVLGPNYKGKLGTDRGTSYKAGPLQEIRMQKCLSHVLGNISEVEDADTVNNQTYCRELKTTLSQAIDLWREHQAGAMKLHAYRKAGQPLKQKLSQQLREGQLLSQAQERLRKGLAKEDAKGRLTLFLHHPDIEPTNNIAERGLRPAVIARKVSHCSKTEEGARTYAVMRTLTGTLRLRRVDPATGLAQLLEGHPFPSGVN